MKDELVPLHDILKEIAFLHDLRNRTTFEQFKNNPADIRAASYAVLVISEAVRRIPSAWLDAHSGIPWQAIRTIGNKLRHEYQRISDAILWGIIDTHSAELKTAIEALIEEHRR